MIDLNDLRIFERVASLGSFTEAGRALGIPKSSVSRSIARLEAALSVRLLQRSTREILLTDPGSVLLERCARLLGQLDETVDYVGGLSADPRGLLRVSAGIGFGVNVLADLLPRFLVLYPKVDVTLDLSSQTANLVADAVDVAIRMGPMPDSGAVARRLGILHRYLCASPDYLERRGTPATIADLREHDLIELPVANGSRTPWIFHWDGTVIEHRQTPRVVVNDALTIHRMLVNGAGIGLSSGYLCVPEFQARRLTWLLPDHVVVPVEVHAVFPSRRQLSPVVRAFVDFMVEHCRVGEGWQNDPFANEQGAHRPAERKHGRRRPGDGATQPVANVSSG